MKLNNWFKISYVSRDITYKTFIVILSILIVFKFFLIRESEIIAHPKDAYLYILIAKQKIWFPEYMNTNAYIYSMGYPLFIILSNILKIPLRIGHEIFYIFSNLLLIYGLRLLKIPRIVCVLVFSVLTFHLSTFQYFNTAMTESIVISLYHIVIGLMILIITSKRSTYKLLYSIISGLVLGFILMTRQETFIIYLCYLSLTLLILLDGRRRIYLAMSKVIYTVIIPMIMSLLLVYFVSSLNYLYTGVPGLSFPNSPAFKSVISQIGNIGTKTNTPDTQERIIDTRITRNQLREAYQASPTLKSLEPLIESSLHRKLSRYLGDSADTSNVEVTVDIVSWSLMEGGQEYIKNNSLNVKESNQKAAYQLMVIIDQELQKAFDTNKLTKKKRDFASPLKNIGSEITLLKASIAKVISYLIFPTYRVDNILAIVDDPRVTEKIASDFNQVANRRASVIGMKNSTLMKYLQKTSKIIAYLNIAGIISFVIVFIYYLRGQVNAPGFRKYIFILSFALLLIMLRVVLYTSVDLLVFLIPSRYLFPSAPLLSALSLLNIFVTLKLILKKKMGQAHPNH